MTKPKQTKPAPMKPAIMWAIVNNASGAIQSVHHTRSQANWYAYARAERVVRVRVEEVAK